MTRVMTRMHGVRWHFYVRGSPLPTVKPSLLSLLRTSVLDWALQLQRGALRNRGLSESERPALTLSPPPTAVLRCTATHLVAFNPFPLPGIPHGAPLGRRTRPEASHAAPEVPR